MDEFNNNDMNNNVPNQPPMGQPPQGPGGGNPTMGILALIFGIVACVFFWVPFFNIVCLGLAVVGLIFAIQGRKNGVSIANAALIVSIIGLALSFIFFWPCTVCVACTACATNSAGDLGNLFSGLY